MWRCVTWRGGAGPRAPPAPRPRAGPRNKPVTAGRVIGCVSEFLNLEVVYVESLERLELMKVLSRSERCIFSYTKNLEYARAAVYGEGDRD